MYLWPDALLALVRRRLEYDPNTGQLKHRPKAASDQRFNLRWAGQPALTSLNAVGSPHGRIEGQTIHARNAAWALHYGVWPEGHVYTANGDKLDLRACNLRMAGKLADVL